MVDPYLELFSSKKAVVAAPGGQMPPMPAPPMDPAMAGGMPPPMDPAMAGGMPPPMDPAMAGGMPPPMDPAMAGGMPPPMDIVGEISSIKAMLQQVMDAQVAMMQAMAPAGMPAPAPMPPMDPAMMDPAAMGLPAAPPPGMVAQASDESEDFTVLMRSITDLLR
jgi:hypothetical protein